MVWNKTITIFCTYTDSTRTERYVRHVLRHTFFDSHKLVATNQGLENANGLSVYIKDKDGYVPAMRYTGTGWTLKEGDKIVTELVPRDYDSMVELAKDYQTYTITSVDYKDYGSVPHFEVGGK